MAVIRVLSCLISLAFPLLAQPNPAELVRRAVACARRSLESRMDYTYTAREEIRHRDSSGGVKSTEVTVSKIILVQGARVDKPVAFNGGAPTPKQQRAYTSAVARVKNNPSEERTRGRAKQREQFEFIDEMSDALQYRLLRQEHVNGRNAYVLEGTPAPGYRANTKAGRFLAKVKGTVWVDEQDLHCVKIEATVTDSCSYGTIFAKLQPGSRIAIQQTRVNGELWLPTRVDLRAEAKILMILGQTVDSTIAYSDYSTPQTGAENALNSR